MTDAPGPDALTSVGGTLHGLLFENPRSGYPLQLSWTFSIDCAEVVRAEGSTRPSIVIDWVPALETDAWDALAGRHVDCSAFSEPVEASVYFFGHHRFDRVELAVLRQNGTELSIRVRVSGDVDGLGLSEVAAHANVTFAGIHVQTAATGTSVEDAADLLRQFTDITGLIGRPRRHNVVFAPSISAVPNGSDQMDE